jgi:hypothetical protein
VDRISSPLASPAKKKRPDRSSQQEKPNNLKGISVGPPCLATREIYNSGAPNAREKITEKLKNGNFCTFPQHSSVASTACTKMLNRK